MPLYKSVFITVLVLFAIGIPAGPVHADEMAAGKSIAKSMCQTCHGMDGQATTAMVPHLSGQPKEYLIIQLKAYRAGKRQDPQMSIIAQMLTDDAIENVAEWYSSIKVSVEPPEM